MTLAVYEGGPAGRSLVSWGAEAEAAAGIARALAGTAFIPDSLKVRDDRNQLDFDATVAQVAAALLTGQELGMSPMASLRSIDVIPPGSGSPALRAAALRGLIQQHGHEIWVVEATSTRAVVRGIRAGSGITQESIWTIDRARKMGLRGFNDPKGSWQRQPSAMLVARATAETARWIASDVILGLPYISEELQDQDPDEPIDGGVVMPPQPPAEPRRRTRRRSSTAPAADATASPSPPQAPIPESGDRQGEDDQGQPAAESPKIKPKQRAALWAGLKRMGLTGRDEALAAVSGWVGREVASSNDLTEAEASTALGALSAEEDRRAAREAQDQAAAEPQEGPPDE